MKSGLTGKEIFEAAGIANTERKDNKYLLKTQIQLV